MDFSELARNQQLEQAIAGMRQFMVTLFAVYESAIEAGFSQEQAFQLTRDFQRNLQIGAVRGNGDGEDGRQ